MTNYNDQMGNMFLTLMDIEASADAATGDGYARGHHEWHTFAILNPSGVTVTIEMSNTPGKTPEDWVPVQSVTASGSVCLHGFYPWLRVSRAASGGAADVKVTLHCAGSIQE
jgi:hypothetical protein